ncbi:MAG TPA: SDR family oxidoreductase, partial [Gaiellaceae bacterium]|nr:SDR family oxidoreductase [Gaiellaceae bacterium]
TGAAMGIGFAVASALAEAGAQVVLADRESEAGKQAAANVGGLFVRADVAEHDELRRMLETAERFGGGIDVLVNNAGGVDEPVYPQAAVERWQRVLDVNLRAVMLATQLALEPLRRRGGGVIVNVASVAGLGAGPHDAPEYAAAKAGVVRLTAALGSLAAEGIRVNAICPDYVDTPAVQRSLAEMTEEERAAVPELVSPNAIAGGVLDLIRDDSLAGRVLVWFAGEPPYLLPSAVPH